MSKVPGIGEPIDTSLMGPDHVRRYIETEGEVGYLWNGVPTLLLTTTGNKSGQPRVSPMIFTPVGDKIVVMASNGGAADHPGWYRNLAAEPRVKVQIKGDRFDALARTAMSPEREELWAAASAEWPRFDAYQARTDRLIPVVVLDRLGT